jgi:hypothetical protein
MQGGVKAVGTEVQHHCDAVSKLRFFHIAVPPAHHNSHIMPPGQINSNLVTVLVGCKNTAGSTAHSKAEFLLV